MNINEPNTKTRKSFDGLKAWFHSKNKMFPRAKHLSVRPVRKHNETLMNICICLVGVDPSPAGQILHGRRAGREP